MGVRALQSNVADSSGHLYGKFTDVNVWSSTLTSQQTTQLQTSCNGAELMGNVVSWDDLKEATVSGAVLDVPSTCDGASHFTHDFVPLSSTLRGCLLKRLQTTYARNYLFHPLLLVLDQCLSNPCNNQHCIDQENGFLCICDPGNMHVLLETIILQLPVLCGNGNNLI